MLAPRTFKRWSGYMEPLHELSRLIQRYTAGSTSARTHDDRLGISFSAVRLKPQPIHRIYEPVFSLVVQGEKRAVIGETPFTCSAGQYLVVSVDLPITIHISVASSKEPYVALGIKLEPAHVATLLLETAAEEGAHLEEAALGVSDAPTELLDAVVRLVRLQDHPRDVPVLRPLLEREILWRLLCGAQGHRVRQIGLADSRLSQIGRAIRFIREHYSESLRIDELARLSAMSVTSFHRQFRAVTMMSPIQYVKQIRLQEARGRLLAGADDVAMVGHAVGYDSASQFSREYKRAYGSPPGQDARLLRASNGIVASAQRR